MVVDPIHSLIEKGLKLDAGLLIEWKQIVAIVSLVRSAFHAILGSMGDFYNLWKHYILINCHHSDFQKMIIRIYIRSKWLWAIIKAFNGLLLVYLVQNLNKIIRWGLNATFPDYIWSYNKKSIECLTQLISETYSQSSQY